MWAAAFSLLLLVTPGLCERSPATELYDDWYPEIADYNKETDAQFLENNILRGIDSSLDEQFCDDPYATFCGVNDDKNPVRPLHLRQAYQQIRNHIVDLLGQPAISDEVSSLSVEKELFQKCMKLGLKNNTADLRATMDFMKDLFEHVLNRRDNWQDIDMQLNLRGFDFTFFDVGIERNPEAPKENIIVIQPPSSAQIKDLYDWLVTAFDPDNSEYKSDYFEKSNFLGGIDKGEVRQFFQRWTEIFSNSSTQRKQELIDLDKWNEEYKANGSERAASKINWVKLINQDIQRLNSFAIGKESVIIRNKDYFFLLSNLLGDTPNNAIITVMKTKLILGNIRLIDFKYAEFLKHRKRSLFCYENTKLYGASFRLLRDLKKENLNNNIIEYYKILDNMIRNIASVMLSVINDSEDLNSKEKTYLKAQVKIITSNVIKYNKYRDTVNDYYDNYQLSPSYFESIVNYRKMLKEKELKTLVNFSKNLNEPMPFSVIDLARPRNRFIVSVLANSFLLSDAPVPSGLQKEIHYGVYGVNIASSLYGLLNENGFNTAVNLTGRVNWNERPRYPTKSLQCFVGEDVKAYGWNSASETVSQIFGARIAYQAMLKDYSESTGDRPKQYLVVDPASREMQELDADNLFFIAYGKYHCSLGQKALNTILLNLDEYNSTFECEEDGKSISKCPLNGFQIQRRRYFVNKPF